MLNRGGRVSGSDRVIWGGTKRFLNHAGIIWARKAERKVKSTIRIRIRFPELWRTGSSGSLTLPSFPSYTSAMMAAVRPFAKTDSILSCSPAPRLLTGHCEKVRTCSKKPSQGALSHIRPSPVNSSEADPSRCPNDDGRGPSAGATDAVVRLTGF